MEAAQQVLKQIKDGRRGWCVLATVALQGIVVVLCYDSTGFFMDTLIEKYNVSYQMVGGALSLSSVLSMVIVQLFGWVYIIVVHNKSQRT